MRVLVTNDDGVDSVGIQVLAATLARVDDLEVLVVAPDGDKSGTSASLGGFDPETRLDARAVQFPQAPGIEAWAIDAPPAMCVLTALLGGFGEAPQLVVSGINAGLNTGRAVLHSGTVGAVLTGQNFGVSGLAVSVRTSDDWQWQTAADIAVEVLGWLRNAPPRSVLNLNVPSVPREEVRGISWGRLAPFGEVRAAMGSTEVDDDPDGQPRRRLDMQLKLSEQDHDSDTDQGLVRAGYASLTTLVGVTEAWPDEDYGHGETIDVDDITEQLVPGASLSVAHRVPDPANGATLRRPTLTI